MVLADRVRELIDERDDGNIASAAKRTGLRYGTLYEVVTGRSINPSVETIQAIATAYGVSVDSLLGPEVKDSGRVADASPAEHIIRVLGHPAGLRDVLGNRVGISDIIQTAYAIAFRDRLPPEEMRKLDRWRDQLLQSDNSPAAPHNADSRKGS